MKTLVKSLMVLTGLLTFASCEDDRIYPSPQKYVEPRVTAAVPFNSEFTTTFEKRIINTLSLTDFGSDVYWNLWFMGFEMEQPFYYLQQTGTGSSAGIGNFTIKIESWWSTVDCKGFTTGEITTGAGDVLYVNIGNISFTPEFPYDKTTMDLFFSAGGGLGKYKYCTGMGTVSIYASDLPSNAMSHKWEGELTLVKSKY